MPVNLRIPAGTPNGRTFRVRGKGVRRADGTLGDLLVKVDVQVPSQLTESAREALEKFRDATKGDDLRGDLLSKGRT
jgi:molecular chaperone DnaJ